MVKPYNLREFQSADNSHRQCMDQMHAASRSQGELGIRSIQIWVASLVPLLEGAEVADYAADIQLRATAAWAEAIVWEVQSLDATAAAMGVTRQYLLDQMAAAPATSFS